MSVDLDAVLEELGGFGKHQRRNYALILVVIAFSAIYNAQYIFTAGAVNYRCLVPECEESPPQFAAPWGPTALPDGDAARCSRLEPTGLDSCSLDAFLQNSSVSCDQWVYESHDTIVAEFDLACSEWRRTLVGTIHSVGMFPALPLIGYTSDTFGRRTALYLSAVSAGVMGLVRSFSVSYPMYLTFEFLDAMLGSGVYSTGFILALEMVGVKYRVLAGNLISITYALGQVLLALVAWGVPEWRTLTRVIYTPSLLFFLYYFLVEESVRWLLSKGRKTEASAILFKAANTNKKTLSKDLVNALLDNTSNQEQGADKKEQTSLAMQVLKSRGMVARVAVCSFWWITVTFVYYGLSINSVSLAGSSYLNYALTSLVEIPGYLLSVFCLNRFGRKHPIMAAFLMCGVALVSLPFVPDTLPWLVTVLSMFGKMMISMVFSSIYIYTAELFPTQLRHSLLGFCSMVGRIGSIIAPQTPLLMSIMFSLPYLLFGALSLIAGVLVMLTPETQNRSLPDTVEQAENLKR